MHDNPNDHVLRQQDLDLSKEYMTGLVQESEFFRFYAQIRWSAERDYCTRYFFQSMLTWRNHHCIISLRRDDGSHVDSKEEVASIIV